MTTQEQNFTGIWLHEGDKRGEDFSHSAADYDHAEGEVRMRHVFVEQGGGKIGVWVPEHWTEDQAREALRANW
jgi:hypothetical protein